MDKEMLNRLGQLAECDDELRDWLILNGASIVTSIKQDRGWTYRDMENETKVDFGLLCNIVNGKREMTIGAAKKLARFLQRSDE